MPIWIPPRPPRDDRPAGEKGFVSLRDTFAAAALTGLVASKADLEDTMQGVCYSAYRWADAMLRERGNHSEKPISSTNHDAVPEAIATNDGGTSEDAVGTGNAGESLSGSLPGYLGDGVSPSHNDKNLHHTQRPVAWAVVHACGFGGVVDCYTSKQWCQYHFPGPDFRYVPLYRSPQPTLTDEERKAVEVVTDWATGHVGEDDPGVIALRKLLERTKGGER